MKTTLAFDVYGTLIDTRGVYNALEKLVGTLADTFTETWRAKQLEYTFRRGLMQNYVNFEVCTRNALDFTCLQLNTYITDEEKAILMHQYSILPSYPDVKESLIKLKTSNYRLFAFSNGREKDVRGLLQNAGISQFFEDIISVDDIGSFKPNPAVYEHFLQKSKSSKTDSWLISGNPFDVIGAIFTGMRSVWVRRNRNIIFDPWEIQPTEIINELPELIKVLKV
ncbi:MAG: haloacid dehalogenase type II [Bacteroidales bacterium]|nr:haloacid dehalogenase type II [Bacteroidales bacterium]